MPIRRTVGRDGRVYYFSDRGRRLPERTGARRYVRENFESVDRTNLSRREQRSYDASTRARNQFRFDGRFVPNPFGVFNRFLVARGLPAEQRNLTNFFTQEQVNRILDNEYTSDLSTFRNNVRSIFESFQTASGDLLDSYNEIDSYVRRGYSFEFNATDENGVTRRYTGNEALEMLRNYENFWQQYYLGQRGDALDNVEFIHRIRVNPSNRTIIIDTDDTEIIPRGGTP